VLWDGSGGRDRSRGRDRDRGRDRGQGSRLGQGQGQGQGAGQQVIDVWGGGFWLTGRCHFHNIPTCLGMQNR